MSMNEGTVPFYFLVYKNLRITDNSTSRITIYVLAVQRYRALLLVRTFETREPVPVWLGRSNQIYSEEVDRLWIYYGVSSSAWASLFLVYIVLNRRKCTDCPGEVFLGLLFSSQEGVRSKFRKYTRICLPASRFVDVIENFLWFLNFLGNVIFFYFCFI